MSAFTNRQRDITSRNRQPNLPPRPGHAPRDSTASDREREKDRDRDRNRERGRDARPQAYRQNLGFSPTNPGSSHPQSPEMSEGPTENGRTPCQRTPAPRASPPQSPALAHHPDLKAILDGISLRTMHYIELNSALETQQKTEGILGNPSPSDCYSRQAMHNMHLNWSKVRSAKATKKLDEADMKASVLITSMLDKQSKSSQSTESFKAQIASLQNAMEASINERFDEKHRDLKSAMTNCIEKKASDMETAMLSRLDDKARAIEAAMTKRYSQKLKDQENSLVKRLEKKLEDQEALLETRLGRKIQDQDALLIQRLEAKMNEQSATLEESFRQKTVAMETSFTTKHKEETAQYESRMNQQEDRIKHQGELLVQQEEQMGQHRAAIASQAEQQIEKQSQAVTVVEQKLNTLDASLQAYQEKLEQQRQAEKIEVFQRLDQQNVRFNTVSDSLEDLRDTVDKVRDSASDAKEQLSQLNEGLDLVGLKQLKDQTVTQHQLLEGLQLHRSQFEAQIREVMEARSRTVESSLVGTSLSAEQLEIRLLVQYKDLNRDIQRLELRVERLEKVPSRADPLSNLGHQVDQIPARSMADEQIKSLVDGKVAVVKEEFKIKFEKAADFLDTLLESEIKQRDEVIMPKVDKLVSDLAALHGKVNSLEVTADEADESSKKAKTDVDALKAQLDLLSSAGEEMVRLKAECEDFANRIAHISEWQNNFNSADLIKDMTNVINSMSPDSPQSKVNDLAGRVASLEQCIRQMTDYDPPQKRRKVSANGNPMIVHSNT